MDFNRDCFPNIQNQYNSFLKAYKMNVELTNLQAADSANKRMAEWFQNSWKNGNALKTIAQTRCASSYGLLQMMYTTARERGYNKTALPENLNEIELFDDWLIYQLDLLHKNVNSENDWNQGYEKTYEVNILANWNHATIYPNTIFSNSLKFFPQK